jgi:hypothetical protein
MVLDLMLRGLNVLAATMQVTVLDHARTVDMLIGCA